MQERIELHKQHEYKFKKMLAKADSERGSTLLNSSILPMWQAENTPKIEKPTFENFMRWRML